MRSDSVGREELSTPFVPTPFGARRLPPAARLPPAVRPTARRPRLHSDACSADTSKASAPKPKVKCGLPWEILNGGGTNGVVSPCRPIWPDPTHSDRIGPDLGRAHRTEPDAIGCDRTRSDEKSLAPRLFKPPSGTRQLACPPGGTPRPAGTGAPAPCDVLYGEYREPGSRGNFGAPG